MKQERDVSSLIALLSGRGKLHQQWCDEDMNRSILPLRERLHVPSVKYTGKQVTLKRGGYDI